MSENSVAGPGSANRSPAQRRSLRRVDWRVLLPIPEGGFQHLVLLGGPPGLSDVIVEVGLARRVSQEIPAGACADAVAILDDAHVGPEEIAGCLVRGGVLYWEVESRRGARGRWLRREVEGRLRRTELSPTGFYWVQPDFERCEIFMPIDTPMPMKWYLRNRTHVFSLWHRLLVSRLGALAAKAAVNVRRTRCCAVTAVAGDPQGVFPSILANPALRREWQSPDTRLLVVNRGGRDESRRVIVFPFHPSSAQPAAVLKFSRLAERNHEVEREQQISTRIRADLDPRMRDSIPAPLGAFTWGRTVVGVETCARGNPLSPHAPVRVRIEDLRLATQWLIGFHGQTQESRDPLSRSLIQTWIESPIASYRGAFGDTEDEARLFDRVRERALSLVGTPFLLVRYAVPLSELNICRSGRDISVMDWEGARVGPALLSLIYFLTLWHQRSRQDGGGPAIVTIQDLYFQPADGVLAARAAEMLDDYMKRLSIDRRLLPVMLVLTWVSRALGRLERHRAFGDSGSDARQENRHVDSVGILAKHADLLFEEPASDAVGGSGFTGRLMTSLLWTLFEGFPAP